MLAAISGARSIHSISGADSTVITVAAAATSSIRTRRRRDPGRHATPSGELDDRRERHADDQGGDDRQQDRARDIERRAQQQDENADGRKLRRRRPDVVGAGDRLRVVDDQGVPPFPPGAEKFHGASRTGRAARRSCRPDRLDAPDTGTRIGRRRRRRCIHCRCQQRSPAGPGSPDIGHRCRPAASADARRHRRCAPTASRRLRLSGAFRHRPI